MSKLLLSKTDEEYLEKCVNFGYGIIIGQQFEPGKYIVAHLAKTEEEDFYPAVVEIARQSMVGSKTLDDINLQALTNQWASAGNMISGSFDLLGIFVAGTSNDFVVESSEVFKTAKKVFRDMHNSLKEASHFDQRTETDDTEYIFLSYCTVAKQAISKIFKFTANGGTFSPMECRFVEKPFQWHIIECNYEMDDVLPIIEASEKINIEVQFIKVIDTLRNNLNSSEIFLQNEYVDDGQTLEAFIKQLREANKTTTSPRESNSAEETLRATIFLPVKCQVTKGQRIYIKEFNGTVRLSGIISSRIWCNPRNTLGDVKRFLREDILRSLLARIQIYCDGLTEPNISTDAIFVSEPPRRVFFNVKANSPHSIQFSEYIFRGESPTVAAAQAKQILDVDIKGDSILDDLEGVPDDETFSDDESLDTLSVKHKIALETPRVRELTRGMYMLGISAALLILLLSTVLHYFLK